MLPPALRQPAAVPAVGNADPKLLFVPPAAPATTSTFQIPVPASTCARRQTRFVASQPMFMPITDVSVGLAIESLIAWVAGRCESDVVNVPLPLTVCVTLDPDRLTLSALLVELIAFPSPSCSRT